ncbi:MAG: dolichyl-phosphate beta-D-mannosyltransferase, partial [Parcubacteria group bacterium]|nr:dolichyl-phosphate beta-D-mannosyltransferase [Parcubacteria group bacterium]
VEKVRTEFQKAPHVVCLSGPYIYHDLPRARQFFVKLYWLFLGMPTYFLVGYMVVGGNFAIRRNTLEKMNGFDTSIEFYGEDTNIARRASKFGKVKFSLALTMPTSGRRLSEQGFLKTGYIYVANFISEVLLKKPAHRDYTDIR